MVGESVQFYTDVYLLKEKKKKELELICNWEVFSFSSYMH